MAELIEFETLSGKENMEKDLYLFESACQNKETEPILRFYAWYPACVSLGRNQTEVGINKEYCEKNKIDITRRITGGRALLHQDELTYSFICPVNFLGNENVQKSYEIISSALIEGFKVLGIDVDFGNSKPDTKYNYCMLLSTGADLNYNGKKIVGSAQYRAKNYILQHGSILYTLNKTHIKNIFGENIENKLITLSEILPSINNSDVINSIKNGFEQYFNVKFL